MRGMRGTWGLWVAIALAEGLGSERCASLSSPTDPCVEVSSQRPRPFNGPFALETLEFPESLVLRSRTVMGDDTRLRDAIREAQKDPTNRTLRIVVLGGSATAGMGCPLGLDHDVHATDVPGLKRDAALFRTPRHAFGNNLCCTWSARLVRYLLRLLPRGNFVVVNAAQGGVDSMYHLVNVQSLFSSPLQLGEIVDAVLLELTLNDDLNGEGDYEALRATAEALVRRLRLLPSRPLVAFVNTPKPGRSRHEPAALAVPHPQHRDVYERVAAAYHAPVVDTMEGDWNLSVALPTIFGPHGAMPMGKHDAIYQNSQGWGHYNVAYHEFVAACVFYGLFNTRLGEPSLGTVPFSPVFSDCDGENARALFCHLGAGEGFMLDFTQPPQSYEYHKWQKNSVAPQFKHLKILSNPGLMEDEKMGQLNLDLARDGWTFGMDRPGKFGWISCNVKNDTARRSLVFDDVQCDAKDANLMVGYLKSYVPIMAVVRVTVTQKNQEHTFDINSFAPQETESVFHVIQERIPFQGQVAVKFTPVLTRQPHKRALAVHNSTAECEHCVRCSSVKFRLMMLGCA